MLGILRCSTYGVVALTGQSIWYWHGKLYIGLLSFLFPQPCELNRTTIASVWSENAKSITNQSNTLICDRSNQEDDFMTTCEQHLWSAVEFAIYTGKSIHSILNYSRLVESCLPSSICCWRCFLCATLCPCTFQSKVHNDEPGRSYSTL